MKFILSTFLITLTLSFTLKAEENPDIYLKKVITSGKSCNNGLFQRLNNILEVKHKKLPFLPSPRLMDLAISLEMMCPWSVERDFNGDNRDDWVGYVKIENEYHLLAYISQPRTYKVITIEKSNNIPKNNYLQWIQTKHLKHYTKKNIPKGKASYALKVVNIKEMADFYLWTDNELKKIITTSQFF